MVRDDEPTRIANYIAYAVDARESESVIIAELVRMGVPAESAGTLVNQAVNLKEREWAMRSSERKTVAARDRQKIRSTAGEFVAGLLTNFIVCFVASFVLSVIASIHTVFEVIATLGQKAAETILPIGISALAAQMRTAGFAVGCGVGTLAFWLVLAFLLKP